VTLAVSADRSLSVTVDGITLSVGVPPVGIGSIALELGIHDPASGVQLEALYDDVVCTMR
jgi:hypothetical protein